MKSKATAKVSTKHPLKLSIEAWLAEHKQCDDTEGYLSSLEMMEALGVCRQIVTDFLGKINKEGKLLIKSRKCKRIDGRTFNQPVYKIIS